MVNSLFGQDTGPSFDSMGTGFDTGADSSFNFDDELNLPDQQDVATQHIVTQETNAFGTKTPPGSSLYNSPYTVTPELAQNPAVQGAMAAGQRLSGEGKTQSPYIVAVDYSKPATEKRLFVINRNTNQVVFQSEVAQGRDGFSNTPDSKQSSVGTFMTGDMYYSESMGKNARRLRGLDPTNNNAEKRGIVLHGASYVGDGKTGRSYGCLAVPDAVAGQFMELVGKDAVVYSYAGEDGLGGSGAPNTAGQDGKALSWLDAPEPMLPGREKVRGYRNFNPTNISKTETRWPGEMPGEDPNFKTFASHEDGIAASVRNLNSRYMSRGLNTINKIVPVWTTTQKDWPMYKKTLSEATGLKPDEPFSFNALPPQKAVRFMKAMIKMELGFQPYDDTTIINGILRSH